LRRSLLRSKTPDLVRQEFWGLLLAHFAVRGLMHEAALRADEDPDRLSFLHAVRVVRRKLPLLAAFPPGQARPSSARGRAQDERLSTAPVYPIADHTDRRCRRHPDCKVNGIVVSRCRLKLGGPTKHTPTPAGPTPRGLAARPSSSSCQSYST